MLACTHLFADGGYAEEAMDMKIDGALQNRMKSILAKSPIICDVKLEVHTRVTNHRSMVGIERTYT
jgi:hypothetical protein